MCRFLKEMEQSDDPRDVQRLNDAVSAHILKTTKQNALIAQRE